MRSGLPLDPIWRWHDLRARVRESRQSAPSTLIGCLGGSHPFPLPQRAARGSVSPKLLGGSAAAVLKVPTPTPGPQSSPLSVSKERHRASAGLSRNRASGREGRGTGAGGRRSSSREAGCEDQCPGHGWRSRERAQALHPPGFVKRCTAKGQLERVSWPGPLSSPPPTPGQGLISARFPSTLQAAGVASFPPSSPPASSSPTPGKAAGEGPYLRIDFGVLRRCAAAQAAQKHQQQRQQLRPRSRLPAAKETARPARPSGRAPVAAHARGARPLAGAGSPHAARNLRRSLAHRPSLGKFPRPRRSGPGRSGRAEPAH